MPPTYSLGFEDSTFSGISIDTGLCRLPFSFHSLSKLFVVRKKGTECGGGKGEGDSEHLFLERLMAKRWLRRWMNKKSIWRERDRGHCGPRDVQFARPVQPALFSFGGSSAETLLAEGVAEQLSAFALHEKVELSRRLDWRRRQTRQSNFEASVLAHGTGRYLECQVANGSL